MHIVSGTLRKAPFIKEGCGQNQDSTMFVVEVSEVIKPHNGGENEYTNYSAAFFAKTPAAKEFYYKAFAEGSFVVIAAEKLKIKRSQCGQYIKLDCVNAKLEGCKPVEGAQAPQQQQGGWGQPQQPAQQQHGGWGQPQQQQQQAPQQQYNEPPMDFDDEIPF